MRFKQWINLLAAFVAVIVAGQQSGLAAIKIQSQQEQAAQVEFITPGELKAKIEKNDSVTIVDLRAPSLYAQSDNKIKGAVFVKVRRVAHRLRNVPPDQEIVTYCACPADEAAIIGARALLAKGYKRVRVLKGGWNAWVQAGGQVQPKPKT